MNPRTCAAFIAAAGALGGAINALLSDNGFLFPRLEEGVWCPGALSNILVGAFAAFASWSFYGAGAAIEIVAAQSTERGQISLRFSALAGALIVGVAGAKWITNEVDKQLLKEGIKSASAATGREEDHHRLIKGSARRVLRRLKHAQ